MNQFHSVGEIIAMLKRRGWLIMGIFLAGCLLSVNFALSQQKVYEATAVVQIEDASVAATQATAQDASATTRRLQLIEQRIMSRDNLLRVMDKHDLFSSDPTLGEGERVYMMRRAASIKEISNPTQSFGAASMPSGLMITVQLADADKAAEVANELMETVIASSRDRSIRQARDTLSFYQEEEARVDTEIVALEDTIAEYKRQNAGLLPGGVMELRTQLSTLKDTVLELDQQIITMQADTTRRRAEDIARQSQLLEDQKGLVAARITEIETQLNAAPAVERELSRMEREMDKLREQYGVVTRAKAEAEIGQALEDSQARGGFEVLETALVPENPMTSSAKKIAAVGAFGSMMLALAAALVLELMNPAIRNQQQMERLLGIQPVVVIPVVDTARDRTTGGLGMLAKGLGLVALLGGLTAALAKFGNLGSLLPRRAARG